MSGYTPGPWEAALMPSPLYTGIVAIVKSELAILTDGRPAYPNEWAANARLIAAAPDLLEALKVAYVDSDYPEGHPTLKLMRAAIAKAEGGK